MPRFPYDLETVYSERVGDLFKYMGRLYLLEVRKLLIDPEFQQRLNSFSIRYNTFQMSKLRKQLREVREKIFKTPKFLKAIKGLGGMLETLDGRVKKDIKKVFKAAGFHFDSLPLQADSQMLKESVERNVNLIEGIKEKQTENLENAVIDAVNQGANFDTIINEVDSQSDKGIAYAQFVARDQMAKAYGDINQERQKQAGFDKYKWQATKGDWSHVRETHKEQHGKTLEWSNPPMVGNRRLNPGEDYQCRCIAVPVFEDIKPDTEQDKEALELAELAGVI